MAEPKFRDRLVGGWRLTGYEVTVDGKTDHPLGQNPQVQFDGSDALVLSVSEPDAHGVTTTQTVHWARQPQR